MAFENIELSTQNFSYGPVSGRIYNIDHVSDSMIVKTYPGGTLVDTSPSTAKIQNEVISLDYDGYYHWSLSRLGLAGNLGVLLQKWYYDGNLLIKQTGVGNEIPLIHGGGVRFDSEAFLLGGYKTTLISSATAGSK